MTPVRSTLHDLSRWGALSLSVLLLVALVTSACSGSLESQIVGKWNGAGGSVEFFRDGTLISLGGLLPASGRYSFVEQDRVRMQLDGLGSVLGPIMARVAISGDELTLTPESPAPPIKLRRAR
jgi:hypothetical protein